VACDAGSYFVHLQRPEVVTDEGEPFSLAVRQLGIPSETSLPRKEYAPRPRVACAQPSHRRRRAGLTIVLGPEAGTNGKVAARN